MNFFSSAIAWITSLQAIVLVPLAIFIFSLIARMKIGKAFRNSIMIGIGLVGMFALINAMASAAIPALMGFVQATGLKLTMIDMGNNTLFPVVAAFKLYIWFIPLAFLVNIVMVIFKLTKTFNVDILNFFIYGISAMVVYTLTDNVWLSLLAFVINVIICLKLADWSAPKIQEYYQTPGISIPHGNAILWFPIAIAMNWIIEHIPGLNKLKADPETIRTKFGVIGEPVTIGLVFGTLLGLIGREGVATSLAVGVTIAATMILFPKMVGIMMEGLVPISEAVRDFTKTKFKRELYIGLDAAILTGFPENLAVGILLIPISLLLAFILPGNKVLPMGDLAIAGPFLIATCMPFLKGNVVRGLITGTVIFTIVLYVSGFLGPIYSTAAVASGAAARLNIPSGTVWTSIGAGTQLVSWLFATVLHLFGYGI